MKNRIAALITSAAMLLLSACGGAGSSSTGGSSENAITSAVSSEEDISSARVYVEGTKLMVDGKEFWVNGVNTPWQYWNDFGGKMDAEFWDGQFARMAADHINCTRIWVNCTGENIVRLKTTGEIKEVNEKHWEDLDKLFAIAEKYKVYVMPTILSFDHFKETNGGADKWRTLVQSKEMSDAFAETYVKEFCRRYGDNEYIFCIDLMNEPDWVHENDECGKIGWEDLCYFFGTCAAAVHESCDTLVTVGTGMIKYNSDKYDGNYFSDKFLKEITGRDGAYLDLYSPHYYMWEKSFLGFPFDKSPTDFGLDGTKPVVTGETPNDDEKESGMTAAEKYRSSYDNGWNGVMVWMEYREGTEEVWHEYALTAEATNAMYDYIPEKVDPLGVHSEMREAA